MVIMADKWHNKTVVVLTNSDIHEQGVHEFEWAGFIPDLRYGKEVRIRNRSARDLKERMTVREGL